MRRKLILAGVAALVVAGVYWSWFAPIVVESHAIDRAPITVEVFGTGTLEARVSSVISPRISGRIIAVDVDQGDRVLAGQTLVRLEDADLADQVRMARAAVAESRAALARLTADRQRADAVLTQAVSEHTRVKSLRAASEASATEFDKAVESLGVAQAELARADAAIIEGDARVSSSEANLAFEQTRLAETIIKAPFDGLIVSRSREPGDVVALGSEMLSLISTQEMWIRAWVDETAIARVGVGQTARILFRSETGRAYSGTVTRLGRETDRETREYVVEVGVSELPKQWAVGQRADVFIETLHTEPITQVPLDWIVRRSGPIGVFVRVDGVARFRAITLGEHGRDVVAVIDGVSPGDVLIRSASDDPRLRDGRRVSTP